MVLGIGSEVKIIIRAKDEFSKVFKKVGLSMQNFRRSALGMAAVGGIIAFGLKKAIDSSIELETAMVGVRKTTGLSAEVIGKLRKEFIDLSKIMPVSVTELAQIGEVAGQLGIQGIEDIRSFTEVVAKMSIATELTAENAALALAKISNAMGLPISEAEKLGSAINELSNISAASSSEIVSALTRVAGSANTLGLSTKVVAGLSAALIASGEPAERAGTKLRSAFDSIVKKMDEVVEFMPDFKEVFEVDADQAILTLIKRISQIEDPLERQAKAMDIFGTVGASAINKLSNNLPQMNRLIKASGEQFDNATSLQDEYNIAITSTASQVQLAKNAFTAMQLEIAEVLMPAILPLIKVVRIVFEWFSKLPGPVKQAIVVFFAVTAVIGLLAGAIALVMLVSSPWLLIIGAIILAVTAIILIIANWNKIVRKTVGGLKLLGLGFKNTFIGIGNIVLSVWNGIISIIEFGINKLISFINKLISGINKVLPKRFEISAVGDINLGDFKAELMKFDFGIDSVPNRNSGNTIINIENVNGLDEEDVARALSDRLAEM